MSNNTTIENKEEFRNAVLNTAEELHEIRDLAHQKGRKKAALIISQQESKTLDKLDRLETPLKNDY